MHFQCAVSSNSHSISRYLHRAFCVAAMAKWVIVGQNKVRILLREKLFEVSKKSCDDGRYFLRVGAEHPTNRRRVSSRRITFAENALAESYGCRRQG